jgi:hypothetical protein
LKLKNKFVVGEMAKFGESNIEGIIQSITPGSYLT